MLLCGFTAQAPAGANVEHASAQIHLQLLLTFTLNPMTTSPGRASTESPTTTTSTPNCGVGRGGEGRGGGGEEKRWKILPGKVGHMQGIRGSREMGGRSRSGS